MEKTAVVQRPSPSIDEKLTPSVIDEKLSTDTAEVAVTENEITFPEGGLRAWLTVAGAFLLQFTCFGYVNSFGVYHQYYVQNYLTGYSPSDIGWIGGIQIFFNFASGAFTGRLFDKGYFYHMAVAAAAVHAIGVFMLSLSHPNAYYQVFLTHGVLVGLAGGLSFVPSISVVGHHFFQRRALAVGVACAGSSVGAIVHPILLNKLFTSSIGFHNGIRVSAAINTFLLLISLAIMRTRLPPSKEENKFSFLHWVKTEPAYLSFLIGGFFIYFGFFFPIFDIQLFAVTHGLDKDFAFYTTSILNASFATGIVLPGLLKLVPVFGVFNLVTFFTLAAGVMILSMTAVHDKTGTIIFALFFGVLGGAGIGLTPTMLASLAKDPSEIGSRLGGFYAICGTIGLFASPVAGALLTSEYHWVRPSIFAGVVVMVGGVFYGLARTFYARERGFSRV